jgi:zinc transport system substrate-binding protein
MQGRRIMGGFGAGVVLVLALEVSAASAQSLTAIASIFPVADIAQQIGGEQWDVVTLIPAGASAHTYEPSPEQVRQFARARLFLQIGLGLEYWLEKLVRAAKSPGLITVDLSTGIDTIPVPAPASLSTSRQGADRGHRPNHHTSVKGSDDHTHATEGPDAHYWLDPVRMQQVVTRLEQGFTDLDPAHAALYAERSRRVRAELETLHLEIEQRTRGLRNRSFVGLHAAWTYFAPRYSLVQAAVVEPFPGREPSPRYLAELAQLMRREGVRAIVVEPQLTSAAAQALARETGARVGVLDPYGGRGIPGRESYLDLMRYNVAELVKLLE